MCEVLGLHFQNINAKCVAGLFVFHYLREVKNGYDAMRNFVVTRVAVRNTAATTTFRFNAVLFIDELCKS